MSEATAPLVENRHVKELLDILKENGRDTNKGRCEKRGGRASVHAQDHEEIAKTNQGGTAGCSRASENLGDAGRGEFNLRTGKRDYIPGRNTPRGALDSVHETIARHQVQTRRFAEHAAKSIETQDADLNDGENLTRVNNAADASETSRPPAPPHRVSAEAGAEYPADTEAAPRDGKQPDLPVKDGSGTRYRHDSSYCQHFETRRTGKLKTDKITLTEAMPQKAEANDPPDKGGVKPDYKRGSAYQRRFDEFRLRPDKPDKPRNTGMPPACSVKDAEPQPDYQPEPEQIRTQEPLPDVQPPAKDTPLSYEDAPRSGSERPGRLICDRASAAPKKTPRRRPASLEAAEYIPPSDKTPDITAILPGDHKQHATDEVATGKTPASAKEAGASPAKPANDCGTERSRTEKPDRLRFTEDEAAPSKGAPTDKPPSDRRPASGSKPGKARNKAERSVEKLEKARKKLPKKHHLKIKRTFDEKSQKPKRKLTFDEEVKDQRAHLKGPLVTRPFKAGANAAIVYGHRKIYQAEHQNVGTQAAHRAETLVEGGLRGAYRLHRAAPYRKAMKLQDKTAKLKMRASYEQALQDSPKLKSNMFSRMAQKRKIKKEYAKAVREAQKAARRAEYTGGVLGKAAGAGVRAAARHPLALGIIGAILLPVVVISSLLTFCANIGSGLGGVIAAASYLAQDADADNAELAYTEWETDLLMEIKRTESDYPDYDEYRYHEGGVGHDPYELMAYLTAVYQDFAYIEIEEDLRLLSGEQYQLTFTPSVETRYADPTDADGDGDYEPYDWNILTAVLTSRPFTEVIYPRMNADQRNHYDLLMQSKGGRQYAGSPVDYDWLPYVSCYYGYRVHPISGAKNYHKGVDIAMSIGTDIRAAHDGVVYAGYDADGYGHYITLTGSDGLVTKYAHLDSAIAASGQYVNIGDVIGKSGNSGNSTGPHLHFEVVREGLYLNPLYFSIANAGGAPPVY
ncbi:MAG: peptidoglycan DD-metalloendopeptidase family protein [Synergistaceae bacterium]|nr:peptidoglycan DD-metalloendopeptidase family protein [Synergistaceae bacterium]